MLKDLPDNHDIRHLEDALAHIKNRRVALDIGAHRGIWTKRLVDEFISVIAFEPTELASQITHEAAINQCAVGNISARVSFKAGTENTGQTYVVPGDDVDMITIDSMGLDYIDFIKIDVEGMEYEVIQGAQETIMRCKPAIMLEENGLCERYGYQWGDAGRLVESLGYHHVQRWNKDHLYLP